jgi:hypothetical protein
MRDLVANNTLNKLGHGREQVDTRGVGRRASATMLSPPDAQQGHCGPCAAQDSMIARTASASLTALHLLPAIRVPGATAEW